MISTDNMKLDDLLKLAHDTLKERGLNDLIVASTRGETGLAAASLLKNSKVNLVVVGHSVGFKEANKNELTTEAKTEIERLGGTVLLATMPFHTINDAIRAKMGSSTETLIADALRIMGQGTKVCIEIVAMACDAGLIQSGAKVLAVAGTNRGADTILVVKAANSRRLFDIKITEVIAKPQEL